MSEDGAGKVSMPPARKPRVRSRAGIFSRLRWRLRIIAACAVYGVVVVLSEPALLSGAWSAASWATIFARFRYTEPPSPPDTWQAIAKPGDRLDVAGIPVAYWGRPDAPYGDRVTRVARPPLAIVVHFTDETPAATLVQYGHRGDPARGGGAFGYHFYIDEAGRVLQGAPLSVRTNHIKRANAPERKNLAAHLDGANTIGVSLIGACRSPRLSPLTYQCTTENPTRAQIASGLAVIDALQARFKLPCNAVYGHGELQTDRKSFEGTTLSEHARKRCS